MADTGVAKKARRERGTPNKPKPFAKKVEGWEASLGSSLNAEFLSLAAAVSGSTLMKEMAGNEYKVLRLTCDQLDHCYQLCMQNTSPDMVWTGSGRSTGDKEKKPWDNSNQPRVSVTIAGEQVKVVATHVVLVHNKHLPIMPGLQASHYCHNAACMRHVIWEPRSFNEEKRKKCAKTKSCSCGLLPACDFSLHRDKSAYPEEE